MGCWQAGRSLDVLRQVGLGHLRLGQPTTELSGGDAQRIKLATELQRTQRGQTLYVDGLVETGNTVIVVEHDMRVAAGGDWVMVIGPGAGDEGGHGVTFGTPAEVAGSAISRTAPYLSRFRARLAADASTSNRPAAPQ